MPSETQPELYADRVKIHPRSIKGPFRALKNKVMWGALLLFHLLPWLRWERAANSSDQAILFDISGKRIFLFDLEIWPQDIYILTGIMVFAAVGLFLMAALSGRSWCGFLCFQTIWTDLFMKVEALVEGDRNARIKLDQAPNSLSKLVKRTLKHALWLLISFAFAYSFLCYFEDAYSVSALVLGLELSGWSLATFLTLAGMTYLMAGFAREQVCFYMCPYGRFQGVMLDDYSKVVTYEGWRGEGRGKLAKGEDFINRGHCVDCSLCVQVCPTGIDIRDGQQMECIGCALCVDACNQVMAKLSLPKNLISYDSQSAINARAEGRSVPKQPILRPRVLAYCAILIASLSLSGASLYQRNDVELNVMKDRAPFYVRLSSGQIQNAYELRILNKGKVHKNLKVNVESSQPVSYHVIGHDDKQVGLNAGDVMTVRLIVRTNLPVDQQEALGIKITLQDKEDANLAEKESVFNMPAKKT